jgi:hypothetical protein
VGLTRGWKRPGPAVFRAVVVFEQAHGFGWLRIESRRLEVVAGSLTRWVAPSGPLVQQDGIVTAYTAWIGFPPFMQSTGVVIRPESNEPVLAVVSHWRRRRLLAALEDAGFELDRRRTVFGVGQRQVVRL